MSGRHLDVGISSSRERCGAEAAVRKAWARETCWWPRTNLVSYGPGCITLPQSLVERYSFLSHVQVPLSVRQAPLLQRASFLSSLTPAVLFSCNLEPSPVAAGTPKACCLPASSMTLSKPHPFLCLLSLFTSSKSHLPSKAQVNQPCSM